MPQLVVNMKVRALINISNKLKVSRFKQRYAPYSNRCASCKTETWGSHRLYKTYPMEL